MLVIAKFGGTSLKNADTFRQIYGILQNDNRIKVVVLSAVYSITNQLIKIFQSPHVVRKNLCHNIVVTHEFLIKNLELNTNLIAPKTDYIIKTSVRSFRK